MKKLIIFLLFIVGANTVQSQSLSIEETIDYINDNLKNFSKNEFRLELKTDGILKFRYVSSKIELLNGEIIENGGSYNTYWSDIKLKKDCYSAPCIAFQCKEEKMHPVAGWNVPINCIQLNSTHSPLMIGDFSIEMIGSKNVEKLTNAFNYLFSEVELSEKYNSNDDDDPFAENNTNKIKSYVSGTNDEDKINLETYGGVYKVWVKIGYLNKHFVLDSGASEISLSKNTERELIDNGIIKREDYIEPALFKLANGLIIKCRRLIIPELTIGNYKIKNVRASIGVSNSPLLLGRSFLDNFRKWSIDNAKKELILVK